MPTVEGADKTKIGLFNTVEGLREDSQQHRSYYEGDPGWDGDLRLFSGDHWNTNPPPGVTYITHNMTLRAVEALTASIIGVRPRMEISPAETDGGELFFIPRELAPRLIADLIESQVGMPFGLTMGHLTGDFPLLAEEAQALNPIFPLDDMTRVSDVTITDAYQRVHSQIWERMESDGTWAAIAQGNLIYGTQAVLPEWDSKEHHAITSGLPQKAVWIDPNMIHGDIATARYAGMAELLDADYAIYKYGEQIGEDKLKRWIDEHSDFTGDAAYHLPQWYMQASRFRKMTLLWTWWLRDQPPMDYKLPDGTTRTTNVLQISTLGGATIDHGPCAYRDIPIAWAVNIPRVFDAYGISEPSVMADLQRAINQLWTSLNNHTRQMSNPQQILPASVAEAMGKVKTRLHSHAGRIIPIPDSLLATYGPNVLNMFAYPPQLNSSYVTFLTILIDQFHSLSNQSNVMRGESDPSATSGKAIQSLQAAAGQVMNYRAVWLERAMSQATRTICRMIADYMPEETFVSYAGKYDPTLLRIMRARAHDIDFNAVIELVSGRGQNRLSEKQNTLAMFQAGLLSRQTAMEKLEVEDPETEIFKIAEEQRAIVQQTLAAQAQAGGSQQLALS